EAVRIGAEAGVRVDRKLALAQRYRELRRIRVPGAAAERALLLLLVEPVVGPLPHVAEHVVESPGVGFFLPDGVDLALRVPLRPRVAAELRDAVHQGEAARGPRSTGIFPLRLRRKTVAGGGKLAGPGLQVVGGLE